MRLLKKRICEAKTSRAFAFLQNPLLANIPQSTIPQERDNLISVRPKKTFKRTFAIKSRGLIGKKIVRSFITAIFNFAISDSARHYLTSLLKEAGESFESFTGYIKSIRCFGDHLFSPLSILMPQEEESYEVLAYKKMFKVAIEIFLKFCSVNWILQKKMIDRGIFFRYRYKLLKRIRLFVDSQRN